MLKLQRLHEIPWSRLARGVPRALPSFSSMQWIIANGDARAASRGADFEDEGRLRRRFNYLQEVPMVPLAEYTIIPAVGADEACHDLSRKAKARFQSRSRQRPDCVQGTTASALDCLDGDGIDLAATVPTDAMRYY